MSILVAMSGGVDSSVSAYLMREKHGACKGATMLLFLNEALGISGRHPCCSRENIVDARAVCDVLGIEHEVINFMPEFEESVVKKFADVYESGGTPNPCIDCNKFLKFGEFLRHAETSGHSGIATGHYARIERENSGRFLLRKAVDRSRDQSYVLYMMTQEQLERVEFPLGGMLKSEVRELAQSLGFANARKHDSQDICFVPDGDYGGFIEAYTGKEYPEGDFIDAEGQVIGRHKGIIHYTAGQRRGLGIAAKSRLYVARIDPSENTITLLPEDDSGLYAKGVIVRDVNLIAFDELPENLAVSVKTRYRQKEIPAVANQSGSNELVIEFAERVKSPAVGQSAVMYDGEYVIGGGTIAGVF
ncbi:MAG: tRNA 2-thiouridine(34) synthase MnmA [Synergistaceae bacterium]|nr:tRNA 2-thiouridine(34) synthase MnmA [Synergistaceae bacterium]